MPPVIGSFAQAILDQLAPMEPASQGDALDIFVGGLGSVFQLVEDWASDTADDKVGWSLLVDVDRCPDEALPWLAQLVGVKLVGGLSAADQRQQIRDLAGHKRGRKTTLAAAPAPFLTGAKSVVFRERYNEAVPGPDYPGYLTVITYLDETPDSSLVLNALTLQKPGGIVMTYIVVTGQDFQSLKTNHATFNDVKIAYVTLQGVKADEPGV